MRGSYLVKLLTLLTSLDWMYVMKSDKVLEDGGLLPWMDIIYAVTSATVAHINVRDSGE